MRFFQHLLLWPVNVALNLLAQGTEEQRRAANALIIAQNADLLARLRQESRTAPFQGSRPMAFAYRYAKWLQRYQLYEEARDVWKAVLAGAGLSLRERLECYVELASCLIGLDRYEQAEKEALQPLECLLSAAPERWPASDFSAKIAEFRRDHREEVRLRLQAFRGTEGRRRGLRCEFERQEKIAEAYVNAGYVRGALKHAAGACEAAGTPADRVRGYTLRANLLSDLGQLAEAEEWHRAAGAEAGRDPELIVSAFSAWAGYLLDQGCFSDCDAALFRLRRFAPDHPSYYGLLAKYHLAHGRHKLARVMVARARAVTPADPRSCREHWLDCDLWRISIELDAAYYGLPANLDLARKLLDTAQNAQPHPIPRRMALLARDAALAAMEGNPEGAGERIHAVESCYDRLSQSPPAQETVCDYLARAHLELHHYEQACRWAERFLEICRAPGRRIPVQERLGAVYEGLGDEDRARELREVVAASDFPMRAVRISRAKLGYRVV